MAVKRETLLGKNYRKIQPKLRVISNGSEKVNAVRSMQCGSVAVDSEKLFREAEPLTVEQVQPTKATDLSKSAKRGSLKELATDVYTNVFIQTIRPQTEKLPGETSRRGNIITATVNFEQLKQLADNENVSFVEAGANVNAPTPTISNGKVSEPLLTRWNFGSAAKHHNGEGVLIGIIDVQGFDFSHSDFLDADVLIVLTNEPQVALNYKKNNEKRLDYMNATNAKKYLNEGHFAEGSMKPKIEAAICFVEKNIKRKALITDYNCLSDALQNKNGTWIYNKNGEEK